MKTLAELYAALASLEKGSEMEAIIKAEIARGCEYAFSEEILQAAAAKPWAADGFTLSDRTTQGDKIVTAYVAGVIANCIKENQTVYQASRAIFDGYKNGGVIPEQEIPDFMHSLIRAAKPDMRTGPEFKRALRNVKRNVEKLSTQGMKAAYHQITDAILSSNQKRLDKCDICCYAGAYPVLCGTDCSHGTCPSLP